MGIEPRSPATPLSLGQFTDGELYDLPDLELYHTKFSHIGLRDDVVIKAPSGPGFFAYLKYVKRERSDPDDIRRSEELERFSSLERLLEKYPRFRQTRELCGAKKTHYLLVHRLQYERLQGSPLTIPESRFVVAKKSLAGVDRTISPPAGSSRLAVAWFFLRSCVPAIVQASVQGWSLYSMFDHRNEVLHAEWRPYLPAISNVLSEVLRSPLRDHINWNIKNLIFDKAARKLYYVDLKPSTMFGRSANEHNIRGIREVFIV